MLAAQFAKKIKYIEENISNSALPFSKETNILNFYFIFLIRAKSYK
jgi:hypothetical protein